MNDQAASSVFLHPVRVLWIGDAEHREFLATAQWLTVHTNLTIAPNFDNAVELLQRSAADSKMDERELQPAVILMAQSRPGQFSGGQIDQLRNALPLSRMVALLGSWCEGEMRTGRPWPGVVRIYWHQWKPRFHRELAKISRQEHSTWDSPTTFTEAERSSSIMPSDTRSHPGMIAISAENIVTFQSLSDACSQAGYGTLWLVPRQPVVVQGAEVVLCDMSSVNKSQQERLRRLVQQMSPSPVLALIGFPRWEDRNKVLQAGAWEVISKPYLIDDLIWYVEHAQQATATASRKNAAA